MYSIVINNIEYKLLSLYDVAEKILLNEYTDNSLHDDFDNFIDEIYSPITIFDITYNISFVFQQVDEIAYNCSFHEYKDSYITDIINDIKKELLNNDEEQEILYKNSNNCYKIKYCK